MSDAMTEMEAGISAIIEEGVSTRGRIRFGANTMAKLRSTHTDERERADEQERQNLHPLHAHLACLAHSLVWTHLVDGDVRRHLEQEGAQEGQVA
jgi:hypothetical protein